MQTTQGNDPERLAGRQGEAAQGVDYPLPLRDELLMQDELIFTVNRVLIPKEMQRFMQGLIYCAHLIVSEL